MEKYNITRESQKYIKFILKNNLLNNEFLKYKDTIEKSACLNKITKIINETHLMYNQSDITHIKHPSKLSNNKKYPVVYKLFQKLYQHRLIKLIVKKLNDMQYDELCEILHVSDINKFIVFFNRYQHLFTYNELKYNDDIKHIKYIVDLLDYMFSNDPLCEILYDNPFMPINIQYDAENHDLVHDEYISKDGSQIHLYTYLNDKHNIDVHLIFNMINTLKNIVETKRPVKLIIFNSELKKQLDEIKCDCKHLSPVNINTGSTLKTQYIKIWRNEEIYKVLIHELVHYYNIDMNFSRSHVKDCDDEIKNIFSIEPNSVDYVNESYTEIVAMMIHTSYISYITKIDLYLLLWLELSFTMIQVAKIISYYDLKKSECMIKETYGCNKKKISQSTSVLSYFIIKGCLFYEFTKILKFMDDDIIFNNRETYYAIIIKDALVNNKFHDTVNNNINFLIALPHSDILKSLRMSCVQIE